MRRGTEQVILVDVNFFIAITKSGVTKEKMGPIIRVKVSKNDFIAVAAHVDRVKGSMCDISTGDGCNIADIGVEDSLDMGPQVLANISEHRANVEPRLVTCEM
jgi:hypothetical protein